jgi:heme/copper-type cytochrome/quinol oxidase subunit 3
MSSSDKAALKDLASDSNDTMDKSCDMKEHKYEHQDVFWGSSMVWGFIIFIIVWVIVFAIIVSCEPDFVYGGKGKKCDDDYSSSSDHKHDKAEYGAALLYSFLITLVVFIIFYVLFYASSYTRSSC